MDSLRSAIQKDIPEAQVTVVVSKRRGAFEVIVNGKLIFSRLQTGDYPNHNKVINMLHDVQKGKSISQIKQSSSKSGRCLIL